jgi:hemerythrin-like domain-containing protein
VHAALRAGGGKPLSTVLKPNLATELDPPLESAAEQPVKATDELRNEHEGIKLMLRILAAIGARAEQAQPVAGEDLDAVAEFLSVFADACHHGKEEAYLFPAMEAAGVPREGGPIGIMLNEHSMGRALIAELKEAMAAHKAGGATAGAHLASLAHRYVELLTRHIEKENTVLFPMAEARLGSAVDDDLVEAFEALERDRIGPGKHEEFHALLKRLEEEYLG